MLSNLDLLNIKKEWNEDDWIYILGSEWLLELLTILYVDKKKSDWHPNNWTKMKDLVEEDSDYIVENEESEAYLEEIPF